MCLWRQAQFPLVEADLPPESVPQLMRLPAGCNCAQSYWALPPSTCCVRRSALTSARRPPGSEVSPGRLSCLAPLQQASPFLPPSTLSPSALGSSFRQLLQHRGRSDIRSSREPATLRRGNWKIPLLLSGIHALVLHRSTASALPDSSAAAAALPAGPQPHRREIHPRRQESGSGGVSSRPTAWAWLIGETSEIATRLLLYQGVTLAAPARCTAASPNLGENGWWRRPATCSGDQRG